MKDQDQWAGQVGRNAPITVPHYPTYYTTVPIEQQIQNRPQNQTTQQ